MRTIEVVKSQDPATKHVVRYEDDLVGEVTYLSYPTKDVICVPSQTACRMRCKFCFLSNEGANLKYRNLTATEMVSLVAEARKSPLKDDNKPLLVSFMGAGEPLLNKSVPLAMDILKNGFGTRARFALATMLPALHENTFLGLVDEVRYRHLPLKIHLSLHFPDDQRRREFMPSAADIQTSLTLLETYNRVTGMPVEIHYTLMENVNDHTADAEALARQVAPRGIPVKVLHYSENPAMGPVKPSNRSGLFLWDLERLGVKAEFYKPFGLDVGASCGQFDLSRYVRAS